MAKLIPAPAVYVAVRTERESVAVTRCDLRRNRSRSATWPGYAADDKCDEGNRRNNEQPSSISLSHEVGTKGFSFMLSFERIISKFGKKIVKSARGSFDVLKGNGPSVKNGLSTVPIILPVAKDRGFGVD